MSHSTTLRRSFAVVFAFACLATQVSAQEAPAGPDRGGFTLLLNLGVGFQHDAWFGETKTGLGGLNLGIGGFLTDDLALLFRASGTVADYDGVTQTSGVGAASLQYWATDQLSLEGGVGMGFWDAEGTNDRGAGIVLAVGYAFANRGKHNFSIGVEYAPAFTDPEMVHNVGIVFGWQLL